MALPAGEEAALGGGGVGAGEGLVAGQGGVGALGGDFACEKRDTVSWGFALSVVKV